MDIDNNFDQQGAVGWLAAAFGSIELAASAPAPPAM